MHAYVHHIHIHTNIHVHIYTYKGAETEAVAAQQENLVLLDAETIDVNRGCDGVIIVHDPSRPETLAYSLGLLKDIKDEIPVMLVANFSDVRAFVKTKELTTAVKKRERCASASACSKDGFGVDLVRDFLTVPFLAIKQVSSSSYECILLLIYYSAVPCNQAGARTCILGLFFLY
jgi:hypothetical protein